ncbi:42545_t:CDS:2, partial [Gigaspora margarita]
CGCQDYDTQELINKIPNHESEEQSNSKRLEIKAEKMTEYKYMLASYNKNSNTTITNNCIKETEQAKAQSTSLQNKQHKIVEKDKEYSANDISINIHEWMVTTKQEEKLKECKQGCFGSRDQDLEQQKILHIKRKKSQTC